MITLLILLAAFGILAWGFYRAKPYGKLGIFAWLQSVVLMAPWLLFFGLFAAGIYLNLAGVLLMVILSTGLYIYLGRRLRVLGKDELTTQRAAALANQHSGETAAAENTNTAIGDTAGELSPQPDATDPELIPIPPDDLIAAEGIFGIDTFFRTETIPYQQGAIFKGNLRGDPQETQIKLTQLLEDRLAERYRLFLIEGPENRPVVVVLPSSNDPQPTTTAQKILAVVMGIATLATSLEASGILMGFDFLEQPQRLAEVLPVALGIWAVLIAHEIGHWVKAQQYKIKQHCAIGHE